MTLLRAFIGLLPLAAVLQAAVATAADFAVGDRVLGRWGDGYWYPATVDRLDGDDLEVHFDDGDVARLGKERLRTIDWREGTRLQCNWKNQGRYFRATLAQREGERIEIAYDDGERETATLGRCRSGDAAQGLEQ